MSTVSGKCATATARRSHATGAVVMSQRCTMSRSMESMDRDIVNDSPMNALRRPAHRIVDSRRSLWRPLNTRPITTP